MHRGSYKAFLLTTLFICLVLKSLMTIHFFNISGDKILQVAAASQIAKGRGYTIPTMDGIKPAQQPLILWPPAYSVILVPLIQVTNDITLSALIIDLAIAIGFILILYHILRRMEFPPLITALVLLFQSTQIHEAIADSASSDMLSLDLWLLAILSLVSYLHSRKLQALLLFILFNSVQPWVRYANIPLVIILPLALIAFGIWQKDNGHKKAGLAALSLSIIATAFLLFFNYTRSGQLFFVLAAEKGFFPSNIVHLTPLTLMSMLNIDFLLTQLNLRTGIPYPILYTFARATNFLLLGILGIYCIKLFSRRKIKGIGSSNAELILAGTALISIAAFSILSLLSITRNRNFNINECWTFIEEQRYMLPITFTIMLFLLYHFLVVNKMGQSLYSKIFPALLIAVMCFETAHGIWIIAKGPYPSLHKNAYPRNLPLTRALITKLQEKTPIILADEDYDLRGYGVLQGMPIFSEPKLINKANSDDHMILLRIRKGHEALFPAFFSQLGIEDMGITEGYQFYALKKDRND
jgi:hypothetical protein